MDPLGNGGGSFGFPGPHFRNHWYIRSSLVFWCLYWNSALFT